MGARMPAILSLVLLLTPFCPAQSPAPPLTPPPPAPLPGVDRPLPERFATPPTASRILPIQHVLPLDPAGQDAWLQQLQDRGFGGMATNVCFTDYLRCEDHWTALKRGLEEAKQRGLALWLYDEHGYPSGNAAGLTMEGHPEWEARGLLIAQAESRGGAVALDCPPGTLFRTAAFPIVEGQLNLDGAVDLAGFVKEGKLAWDAPEGDWRVMVITENNLYEGTHAAVSLADKLPYINLLLPEPTARYLEVNHGAYAAHLGDDLGAWFTATFTDEPSLMSLFMRPQPWSVLPWSPNLPVEFEKRRGYALSLVLPRLVWGAGPETAKARYDFWRTVGDLVSENYFGQIQQWCRQHNIPSGGHLLMEEAILTHVPLYGDFFRCARRLDAPSMDCLTSMPSEVPWYVGRLISSVAELEGHTVTMSESSDFSQRYREKSDTRPIHVVSEEEMRGSFNRLMANGITTFTSYYSFDGLSNEQQVRLNEWVGRCCTMLKGGRQVADIAVVYPVETVASRFAPSRNWVNDAPAAAKQVQETYEQASRALFDAGRDFTYVDGQALSEAVVENGVLRVKDLARRALILPCVDTLPVKAWENLAAFWRSGGAVIALGALPANSETEFPSSAASKIAMELFGDTSAVLRASAAGGFALYLSGGQQGLLVRALDAILAPDVTIPAGAPLRTTHRNVDGGEVFFIINDGAEPWSGAVGLCAEGAGEQWDPATGQAGPVADPKAVPLQLAPYGGMLFRFAHAVPPEKCQPAPGPLPGLVPEALPAAAPAAGQGEHVSPETTAANESGPWTARATLTMGDTDTFLFLTFSWPQGIDLGNMEYLVLDLAVPAGQACGQTLLAILRDVRGVEYVADTRLRLDIPGAARAYLPIIQFARAGWLKGPEEPLDPAHITDIRIGWGGYKGREKETIAFTTGPPRVVRKQ